MELLIEKLPVKDRLSLVEKIWDSIVDDEQKIELSDAQNHFLQERLNEFQQDGDIGKPYKSVLNEIRADINLANAKTL